jgi:hypothetical protein
MFLRAVIVWYSLPGLNEEERESAIEGVRVVKDLEERNVRCLDTQLLVKLANQRGFTTLPRLGVATEDVPNVRGEGSLW